MSDLENLKFRLNQSKVESDNKSKRITDLLKENKDLQNIISELQSSVSKVKKEDSPQPSPKKPFPIAHPTSSALIEPSPKKQLTK